MDLETLFPQIIDRINYTFPDLDSTSVEMLTLIIFNHLYYGVSYSPEVEAIVADIAKTS